ncbi:hypothetical protein ACIBW9_20920 [Streptomyces sp. NPDC049541]|uniref:hypothetical protein n=1 Tax=Streptomyces sp. NPDC049541 TaxID=3365594 RepID=UPI0037BBA69D
MEDPQRGIRAVHTESTITVYQAYPPEIGGPAARAGVLDHGIGIPAPYAFGYRNDAGVVPPQISQLSVCPLLVLTLVRRQLLLSLPLRGLGSMPVPLEARLCFGLSLGPATRSPTALRLVVIEIRHGNGPRQWSWIKGLDLFRPHERGSPESRSLAP